MLMELLYQHLVSRTPSKDDFTKLWPKTKICSCPMKPAYPVTEENH